MTDMRDNVIQRCTRWLTDMSVGDTEANSMEDPPGAQETQPLLQRRQCPRLFFIQPLRSSSRQKAD